MWEITIWRHITRQMNSPLRLLNTGAFNHRPYTFVGLNLLWCLSRGWSNLTFYQVAHLTKFKPFLIQVVGFSHRLESEDHTRPWFCPKLVIIFFFVLGFPIGLSPRTIQGLGSVQNLYFFSQLVGFPISLSPRTVQGLGSVQNLYFSSKYFFLCIYFFIFWP